jgi:arylsulfatase A-like enzyme/Flp pilus assembly protein TadD
VRRVILLLVLSAAICVPRAAIAPNIVLVTLDTTRADRMGFLGSTRGLTPALDALARESLVFTRAYAQAPVTTVSHATILSGTYPLYHGVTDFGVPLGATVPYLPDLLRGAGYTTGAFVGSLILDPRTGTAPGFDRGFDWYDAGFRLRRPGENRYQTLERRADDVVSRALEWMGKAPVGRPFFAWIHLFDAHDPYDPPADLRQQYRANPYDGEVAGVDRQVGRLVSALRSAGTLANTVLAVTADHGEALGDHGETTHGVFLYDETLHVPLLMRGPGIKAGRVTARVRLVDLAPAVLEAAQMRPWPAMQGVSLLRATEDRPVYAATEYPRRAFGWSPLVSWRADRFLYVRAPRPELYDVTADPTQSHDIAATRSRVVTGIDAELEKFVKNTAAGGATTGAAVDPAIAERLAALGYVSGSASAPPRGVDPKDRIDTANALHEAVVLVEDGAFDRAVPLLEKVTASDPGIQMAQLQLGFARARQRQYAKAIPALRKAIELQPEAMLAHYELGVSLYETGDLKGAASEFEAVTSRMPKWTDARYSLGSVYVRINRVDEGLRELRAALEQEPRHPRANLLLGRILTLQGQAAAAIPYLQMAVETDPANAEARRFLAEARDKARRP